MPSKSLITSWTTSFVPPGTRFSHSRRKAYLGNSSFSSPRRRVLEHLHGLWKGTSSSKKRQLEGDFVLRRVSSTIIIPGVPGVTLESRPSPTPSSFILSPTTPALLPSGVDTDSNAIKFSEVELKGTIRSGPFNDPSFFTLPFLGVPAASEPALEPPYPCGQHVSSSLPVHLPPPRSASTSLVTGRFLTSGYTRDVATRIQDFRTLIDELRATLLHHDSKEEF